MLDLAKAIIDAVEEHKGHRIPIWLWRIYKQLKKQETK